MTLRKNVGTFDGQESQSTGKGVVGAPIFWRPGSNREIVHKYPFDDIRNGAQVIVHQTQRAFLFLNGALASELPATGEPHQLTTGNIPLLGGFLNIATGGVTSRTAEIWFVNIETEREALWGIGGLPVFDYSINGEFIIGAHGGYNLRICDAILFVRKLVGTIHSFTTEDVVRFFGKKISSIVSEACANIMEKDRLSIASIQRSRSVLERKIESAINEALSSYGVSITNFAIENFNLPEEYHLVLSEQTRGIAERRRLEQLGVDYQKERQLDIIQQAAANEGAGNAMGVGMGLGMGANVGGTMGNMMQNIMPQTPPPPPPPTAPIAQLYFLVNGVQSGPFSFEQTSQLVVSGQITPTTLYWQAGMPQWQVISSSPQLMSLFDSTMPPPPPIV